MTGVDGKVIPLWQVDLSPTGYLIMSADDTLPPVVALDTNDSFEMPKGHPHLRSRDGKNTFMCN